MNELVNFLEQSFLKQKLKRNCHLLVGVSGGIDSVVLGHALSQLRSQYPFDLTFIYVDHQLHPESKKWANTVKRLAKKYQLRTSMRKSPLIKILNYESRAPPENIGIKHSKNINKIF